MLTTEVFPKEIRELKQWTYSYSIEDLRRPVYRGNKADGGLDVDSAITLAGPNKNVGLYVTKQDPYLLLDIDKLDNPEAPFEELPPGLSVFMRKHKTYCEYSPSGKGLRAIFKLKNIEDKDKVRGKYYHTCEELRHAHQDVQINFSGPWQRITGNITHFSTSKIATVTLEEVLPLFNIKLKTMEIAPDTDLEHVETISEVIRAINMVPLDQNPRIRRAYKKVTGQEYQHYDFWVKILMALHHYGKVADKEPEMLTLADQWSAQDKDHYTGSEDVEKKWDSFDKSNEGITYKTLFRIRNESMLKWPKPRKQSKAESKKGIINPIITEYVNYKALMDYFGIVIHRSSADIHEYYLVADEDIITKFFAVPKTKYHFSKYYGPFEIKQLTHAMVLFLQESSFTGMSNAKASDFLNMYLTYEYHSVDLFKLFFETPYEELDPEFRVNQNNIKNSTFNNLYECLKINPITRQRKEPELYKSYYKKWWMGFLRNIFYKGNFGMNNCILVLTGMEQIRKTSHFQYILPPPFRKYIANTVHGFNNDSSIRDVVKITAQNRVVIWDELEQYLNDETEANFKKILDGLPQKLIDKYEVAAKTFQPIAIYGATSNQSKFKISDIGSRRMFHIPLRWVDTSTMEKLDWYTILHELKTEYDKLEEKGIVPWLLTEEELEYQLKLHTNLRAESNLDIMLDDVFLFSGTFDHLEGVTSFQTDTSGKLMTLKDVKKTLKVHGHDLAKITDVNLKKTLIRKCSIFTGTTRKEIDIDRPRCIIKMGEATQSKQFKRFCMPSLTPGRKLFDGTLSIT